MTPNVKEATEQLKAVKEIVDRVAHWAAPSIIRTLALIFSVAIAILGASYLYVDHLLESSKQTRTHQNQQITIGTEQRLLRHSLNLVTECIDSTKEKEPLAPLYCQNAEEAYLARSTLEPYRGWAELSTRQDAYRAMRADLLSRIENGEDEMRRLTWSDPEGKTLDTLLQTNIFALFVTGVIFALLILYALVLRTRRYLPRAPTG